MSFADNLKIIRKARGLSQEDLAELLDVSRQAVSKWEGGDGYPEMEKVLLLSRELRISLDDLMGEGGHEVSAPSPVSGKILIRSFDGKSVANCYKAQASRMSKGTRGNPEYAIFGVDGTGFWTNNTLLGWYAKEEDARREVELITAALMAGKPTYELKYAAKVKATAFSVKLDKE